MKKVDNLYERLIQVADLLDNSHSELLAMSDEFSFPGDNFSSRAEVAAAEAVNDIVDNFDERGLLDLIEQLRKVAKKRAKTLKGVR
jgi:hypothetical protein